MSYIRLNQIRGGNIIEGQYTVRKKPGVLIVKGYNPEIFLKSAVRKSQLALFSSKKLTKGRFEVVIDLKFFLRE